MDDLAFRGNIRRLEDFEGVTRVVLPAGKVLYYRHHLPPGVFLLLRGSVALERGDGSPGLACDRLALLGRLVTTPAQLPPLQCLELPSDVTVVVTEKANLLYIPRSLALSSPAVRELLSHPCFAPGADGQTEAAKTHDLTGTDKAQGQSP